MRWSLELESPLRVLIKARPRLDAGGENTVAAIVIPKAADQPRIVWQAQVAGQPVNALVADGRFVVTTDRGGVYCFGEGEGTTETSPEAVKELHRSPSPPNGYALVVGWPGLDPVADLADRGGHRGMIRPVPAWTEVRLHGDLLFAVFGRHLAAVDRHSGDLRWSRESTRESTLYAIGDGTLHGPENC